MEVIWKIVIVIIKPQQTVTLLAVFISLLIRLLTHLFSHRYVAKREKKGMGVEGREGEGRGDTDVNPCLLLCSLFPEPNFIGRRTN